MRGHGSSGEHGQTLSALPMLRLANGRLPANPTADHVNHGGSPLGLLLTEPFGGGASAGFHHPGSLRLSYRPRTFSVSLLFSDQVVCLGVETPDTRSIATPPSECQDNPFGWLISLTSYECYEFVRGERTHVSVL